MWKGLGSDIPPGIDSFPYGSHPRGERSAKSKDKRNYTTLRDTDLTSPFSGSQFSIPRKSLAGPSGVARFHIKSHPLESTIWGSLEDELRNADAELDLALAESSHAASWREYGQSDLRPRQEETSQSYVQQADTPTSCIICVEDFSDNVTRPAWISQACAHQPSVCSACIAKSIKSDLETRIWDQIRCPECQISLIYEDIKRLADPATFERYERLSFRAAVGSDQNFVWCQECDYGQLHDKGALEPIVRCLNCGFRSCFVHSGPWHSGFTCDEYNEMLQDPENYQSARDKENRNLDLLKRFQEEQDFEAAQELSSRDKHEEEQRQMRRHQQEREKARVAQRKEAEEMKRRRVEEDRRAEKARKEAQERARMEAKRHKENALSMEKMRKTTKQCPGCKWPIEKNRGCDHMTCLMCGYEFCWICMSDYGQIRTHGNSRHQPGCLYHSRNLR